MLNWFSFTPKEPVTLGQLGEQLARLEYKKRGYKVVAANFFNTSGKRAGEIDLIVKNKTQLIFVEVKTRTKEKGYHGTPAEAVNQFKQVRLLKAAKLFLIKNPKLAALRPQIDVLVVIMDDFSQLPQVSANPAKYLPACPLDKLPFYATIIPNAVEDWN